MNRGSLPVLSPAEAARVDAVDRLHGAVDTLTSRIAAIHGDRLACGRGCSGCCADDLSVFEVEAQAIARRYGEVLSGEPHPVGACAFLDAEGACRVYEARPYVCRTQGLPLRWLEDDGQEMRDVCPLNLVDESLEELPAGDCWAIGPVEVRLAALQASAPRTDGDEPRRVTLRSLFAAPG